MLFTVPSSHSLSSIHSYKTIHSSTMSTDFTIIFESSSSTFMTTSHHSHLTWVLSWVYWWWILTRWIHWNLSWIYLLGISNTLRWIWLTWVLTWIWWIWVLSWILVWVHMFGLVIIIIFYH